MVEAGTPTRICGRTPVCIFPRRKPWRNQRKNASLTLPTPVPRCPTNRKGAPERQWAEPNAEARGTGGRMTQNPCCKVLRVEVPLRPIRNQRLRRYHPEGTNAEL